MIFLKMLVGGCKGNMLLERPSYDNENVYQRPVTVSDLDSKSQKRFKGK